MKSGAEVITTCEILGKQTPPRGPPVSLETTDGRPWDFFLAYKPLFCIPNGLLKLCDKKRVSLVCTITSIANTMLYNQQKLKRKNYIFKTRLKPSLKKRLLILCLAVVDLCCCFAGFLYCSEAGSSLSCGHRASHCCGFS